MEVDDGGATVVGERVVAALYATLLSSLIPLFFLLCGEAGEESREGGVAGGRGCAEEGGDGRSRKGGEGDRSRGSGRRGTRLFSERAMMTLVALCSMFVLLQPAPVAHCAHKLHNKRGSQAGPGTREGESSEREEGHKHRSASAVTHLSILLSYCFRHAFGEGTGLQQVGDRAREVYGDRGKSKRERGNQTQTHGMLLLTRLFK
jgi:hypothetical protein